MEMNAITFWYSLNILIFIKKLQREVSEKEKAHCATIEEGLYRNYTEDIYNKALCRHIVAPSFDYYYWKCQLDTKKNKQSVYSEKKIIIFFFCVDLLSTYRK